MSIKTEAIEKIRKAPEPKDNFQKSIYKPISDTLCKFCEQSENFAKAVKEGKTFGECLEAVSKFTLAEKNKGNISLSDDEVYKKAADFYLPGSTIEYEMKIKTPGEPKNNIFSLDFSSLL